MRQDACDVVSQGGTGVLTGSGDAFKPRRVLVVPDEGVTTNGHGVRSGKGHDGIGCLEIEASL